MGFIRALFLKRIVTEKTISKLAKIASIVFYIAGLLSFVFGFIRMKNMNVLSPEDMEIHISFLMLWMLVLILLGLSFEFISKIITIEGDIKDLKDKIKE